MKVAIVIPIYKESLTLNELKSLRQCQSVIGEFDTYLACSETLNTSKYHEAHTSLLKMYFDGKYFESIQNYNKLLLSSFFYDRFSAYDYILIYQLDAYVFKNDLLAWCMKGFDYVGAPWIVKPPITKEKVLFDMSSWFVNKVGNGGLSLRKVRSTSSTLRFYRPIISLFLKNEDMFFGVLVNYLNPFFRKPSVEEALGFAFEMEPRICFSRNNNKLPFAVHAWEKYDAAFWKSWID